MLLEKCEVAVKAIHHTKTCIFQGFLTARSIRSGIKEKSSILRTKEAQVYQILTSFGNVHDILTATRINRDQF